jgi:hypothetical protein
VTGRQKDNYPEVTREQIAALRQMGFQPYRDAKGALYFVPRKRVAKKAQERGPKP